MPESEDDSSNSPTEINYNFNIIPPTNDINQLITTEYLKDHISHLEHRLIVYCNFEVAYCRSIDERNYDTIMDFVSLKTADYSRHSELYARVYDRAIFGADPRLEEELLSYGLRLLFAFPNCFNEMDSVGRDSLIDKLIELALQREEPIATYAIKCLQMATYMLRTKKLRILSFNRLFYNLVERLSAILECNTPMSLLPVLDLKYKRNKEEIICFDQSLNDLVYKDLDDLNIEYFNITIYIDCSVQVNGYGQIFHCMALLKYLIRHLEISTILENTLFLNLLYTCINVSLCKMDDVIILALMIILSLVENDLFFIRFMETKLLSRICVIPHSLASSSCVLSILAKISILPKCMKYIIKNNIEDIEITMKYCIYFIRCLHNKKSCNFITNSFDYPEFYDTFIRQLGIKSIIANMKINKAFVHLKNKDYWEINRDYRYIRKNIKCFLKILITHLFIQIYAITPKFKSVVPAVNFGMIKYSSCDILIKHFEDIGGFKQNLDFFDELLETDNFEVIVSILRMAFQYELDSQKMKIYKRIMCFLRFMSLYHKTKNLFIHAYDPYNKKFNQGNNLIVFFLSLTEKYCEPRSVYYLEFMPFNVYHNMLVSCFPDFKTYKEILKPESNTSIHGYRNNAVLSETDEISNIFMDSLIKQNFIYHSTKFLQNKKLKLTSKTYAIKCLLVLLTRKLATPIIIVLKDDIIYGLQKSLLTIENSISSDDEIRIFYIYSFSLIYKLKQYTSIKSIDHFTPSPPFIPKTEMENKKEENTRQQELDDLKVFNESVASIPKGELSSPKFNAWLDLMNRTLIDNRTCSLLDFKSHTQKLSSSHSAFNPIHSWNKSLFRFRIKSNLYGSIYKKFNKKMHYSYNKENIPQIYDAKKLIDNSVVITYYKGMTCIPYTIENKIDSSEGILHLDDSDNGEFIIGNGLSENSQIRFTNIWRYDSSKPHDNMELKISHKDINYSKIAHDNMHIFGVDSTISAYMINIERSFRVCRFHNENTRSFPRVICVAIDRNDNLLLFNGDLFCSRSAKLIHRFQKFDPHLSGNFVHSDGKILINCELWDTRTLKLYDRLSQLENFIFKNTYINDLLIGIQQNVNYHISYLDQYSYKWKNYVSEYGNKLMIYDVGAFSHLKTFDFDSKIVFANISRDGTRTLVGLEKIFNHSTGSSFQIIEIGSEANTKIEF